MQRKKERSRLDHGCIDEMGPIDSGHLCNQFLSLWKSWAGRILIVEKKGRPYFDWMALNWAAEPLPLPIRLDVLFVLKKGECSLKCIVLKKQNNVSRIICFFLIFD